jgi:bifunctional NMN adenylyltransferase/nudix hydrolase
MKKKMMKAEFGVIVGRFQVPTLHEAHLEIIDEVRAQHERVIIFLGVARTINTVRNPLDVWTRTQMIQAKFPDVIISHIPDFKEDISWVKELDNRIREIAPRGDVMLYGGRDSFIPHYENNGQFQCSYLKTKESLSGTENRRVASRQPLDSPDFRAGMIYAAHSRYPASVQCVDVAILSEDNTEILLGRRDVETQWRLIGGHVEPKHATFEAACREEAQEEAGVSITDPVYVGSFRSTDWRYQKEIDKIMTALFRCRIMFGPPRAGDDIDHIKWYKLKDITEEMVVADHWTMIQVLKEKESKRATES